MAVRLAPEMPDTPAARSLAEQTRERRGLPLAAPEDGDGTTQKQRSAAHFPGAALLLLLANLRRASLGKLVCTAAKKPAPSVGL